MSRSRLSLGWSREIPDVRDYSTLHPRVVEMVQPQDSTASAPYFAGPEEPLPDSTDLSPWCSPVEDQGSLGSCTAHAGVALIEYFESRAFGKHIEGSRLFLYKVTRKLQHQQGDSGCWLRSTMKAMVLFGVPPEEYYPYDPIHFDEEPPSFCYAFAQSFQALRYFRLDPPGTDGEEVLRSLKRHLAGGFPVMFGFSVYGAGNAAGEIEFPKSHDHVEGGHAVVAVGYDESRRIGDCVGAVKIRNSWGPNWGEAGYGWLPFDYVRRGLTADHWTLFKAEYTGTGQFGEPAPAEAKGGSEAHSVHASSNPPSPEPGAREALGADRDARGPDTFAFFLPAGSPPAFSEGSRRPVRRA